jgi:hypothetical protein
MARHEDIVNTIWDDLDHLSDDAFMLYVWSFTNLKCGMAGIYPVTRRKLIEGRFDDARLTAALDELEQDGKLFYVDGVLWNKARVQRLSYISDQIAKSIARDLAEVDGANPLLGRFVERYGSHPKLDPHLTLTRASLEGQQSGSVKGKVRPSTEGHPTLPSQGQGSGQGQGEFEDWLQHYVEVTGYTGTTGSKPARESFTARRREGLSLEELKLATVGCHSDDFNREHHHDVPETILRASKVTRYIKLASGPKVRKGGMAQAERFAQKAREAEAEEARA